MNLANLIEKYQEHAKIHSYEGQRGIIGLCKIIRALGYKDPLYQLQIDRQACVGDFLVFLEDNPGAIEAVIDWISKQNIPEWVEALQNSMQLKE